ncbi:MAG: CRISPR-associated endonuclease Cas1 [Vicinamibacterales bacterium]
MSAEPATVEPRVDRLESLERPRPAEARLRRPPALPDYLPARMLNEYVYCPRLFYYEWVEGVFAHSADTLDGSFKHERVDKKADDMPAAGESSGEERVHSRSVNLSSEAHGIIATIDLVEGTGDEVSPVDYKRGRPREADGDGVPEAWPADRAQVCAQALILRDNGYRCSEAVVYYGATKQRVRVAVDDALVSETIEAIEAARRTAASGRIPVPLIDSPKCPRCSLVGICLPDETAAAMGLEPAEDAVQLWLFEPDDSLEWRPLDARAPLDPGQVRRLVPVRDDLRPLYVTGHNLFVGKSGEVLQVRENKKLLQEARLHEVSQVNLFGNVQMSAAAIEALCFSEKPVAHFSYGGWFYGLTHGLALKNVFLRREQFRRADDPALCLRLSCDLVATKIRNQRTLLQRNHVEPPPVALEQMKRLARRALTASDLESLLGVEGSAARVYFEHFSGMIKVEGGHGEGMSFDMRGRNRRPPRDPVNALLSLAYALLTRDLTIVCHSVGFDPYIGFYHQPRFGRPALALDLMEGFRPLVADSAVLTAINTGMVTPEDFVRAGGAFSLTPTGRKGLIRAYEQRMDGLVTHPLFGYRVSYRRVLEIQARLLARFITGELPRYPGFETR